MTCQTLLPNEVIGLIKQSLGTPTYTVNILIDPVVASRPRVTKWGVYYGKQYTAWKKEADEFLSKSLRPEDYSKILRPCTVVVDQRVRKPKTSKLEYPRGDADNYAKPPLDALTKQEFWTDDDLVTTLVCSKRFAEKGEEPLTEVSVYVH